jgi:hypothetical protein
MVRMARHLSRVLVVLVTAVLAGGLAGAPSYAGQRTAAPLRHAHAHNDYEHERPLAEALPHGFNSVEADIWLVGDQLLIGHEESDLTPDRTLESLYPDPLLARVRTNHGRVYRGYDIALQLLIDIKTAGAPTYTELAGHLERYRSMLSSATDGRVRLRAVTAVTAVISGDRGARAPMEAQHRRLAFYEGRLDDLGTGAPASFIPLVSAIWALSFSWQGTGLFPTDERTKLRQIATAAHAEGRQVRVWATPTSRARRAPPSGTNCSPPASTISIRMTWPVRRPA